LLRFQAVQHDLWDYDLVTGPKLLTVRHNGKMVDVVAQPTKFGFLYVFDRVTGEPLWPIEERAVPQSDVPGEVSSPTQPFPTKPPPFTRQKFTAADINPYIDAADQARLRDILKNARNDGRRPALRALSRRPAAGRRIEDHRPRRPRPDARVQRDHPLRAGSRRRRRLPREPRRRRDPVRRSRRSAGPSAAARTDPLLHS